MSDSPEPKIFSQTEVDRLLMGNRRGLQQTIRDQQAELDFLRAEVARLSCPETNPLASLILATIKSEFAKGRSNDQPA